MALLFVSPVGGFARLPGAMARLTASRKHKTTMLSKAA